MDPIKAQVIGNVMKMQFEPRAQLGSAMDQKINSVAQQVINYIKQNPTVNQSNLRELNRDISNISGSIRGYYMDPMTRQLDPQLGTMFQPKIDPNIIAQRLSNLEQKLARGAVKTDARAQILQPQREVQTASVTQTQQTTTSRVNVGEPRLVFTQKKDEVPLRKAIYEAFSQPRRDMRNLESIFRNDREPGAFRVVPGNVKGTWTLCFRDADSKLKALSNIKLGTPEEAAEVVKREMIITAQRSSVR